MVYGWHTVLLKIETVCVCVCFFFVQKVFSDRFPFTRTSDSEEVPSSSDIYRGKMHKINLFGHCQRYKSPEIVTENCEKKKIEKQRRNQELMSEG